MVAAGQRLTLIEYESYTIIKLNAFCLCKEIDCHVPLTVKLIEHILIIIILVVKRMNIG